MKTPLVRLALALAVMVLGLAASPQGITQARAGIEYPWCAIYSERSVGATNCGFSTFDQCRATISGIGGICVENSAYVASAPKPKRHSRTR